MGCALGRLKNQGVKETLFISRLLFAKRRGYNIASYLGVPGFRSLLEDALA
jgi:hypothetical protein